ncbi:MAG: aminoacylase [Candidatus Accumulibacter cognatus]|uniref:Aminoacylase n=1 Tax=Candidatus Accumulibacter cognatus TaxID=2954383 RepID=A0A7D5SRR7_9PROT|nr:MAG: aminoacylase [Candidatus Accumulibacter cognatus]
MSWIRTIVAVLLGCIGWTSNAFAQDYDLVINGGRVMDPETMYDEIANVGIKGHRIVAITKDKITGEETIDAKGLVVAPGFIDTQFHSLTPFGIKMALRDGVTTALDLENGILNTAEWYDAKANKWQVNYGATVGLGYVRMVVHDGLDIRGGLDTPIATPLLAKAAADGVPGWSVTRSNIDQMNQITARIDEELRQGALGVGGLLAYMAKGVTTYEMYAVQRTAARYGRLTDFHHRFHLSSQTPTEAPLGFDEVFTNAFLTDAPLLMAHNNDYGWWEIEEKLQLARKKGANMWSEHYPYTTGSTIISADFLAPAKWEAKQGYKYEETIYDPQQDKKLNKEEFLAIVKSDPGRIIIVDFPARKKWLPYWLRMEHMTVASDAIPGTDSKGKLLDWDAPYEAFAGHPRTAGAHAATLRLAREASVPLMHSLSQLSYWSALHLGKAGLESMKVRGRLQKGMVADITIFDAANVKDNAGYKVGTNGLPSTGIPYVIVNGTIVVKESKVLKDVFPGQPIRYPVESKGRFEPLDVKGWVNIHAVPLVEHDEGAVANWPKTK